MHNAAKKIRSRKGTTIAEFGPTLMLAFAVMVFPMMAFGMIGFRYLLLYNAAEQAAEFAAKSSTFLNDSTITISGTPTTSYSAVHIAAQIAKNDINGTGNGSVKYNSTTTSIFVCPLGGTTLTTPGPNTPLSGNANTVSNTYNCVVTVNADIQPMFPGVGSLIGNLPGFNAAIPGVTCTASRYFENTANLSQ